MEVIKVILFSLLVILGLVLSGVGVWFGRLIFYPMGETVSRRAFIIRTLGVALVMLFFGIFATVDGLLRLMSLD